MTKLRLSWWRELPQGEPESRLKAGTLDTSLVLFPGATCRALGRSLSLCIPFQSRPQSPPSGLFPHPPGLPFSSSFFLLYIFLILLPSRLYSSECPIVAHLFLYFFCQAFSASIIWLPLSLRFHILDYILLMSFPQQACLTIFCFFPSNSAVTELFL